MNAGFGYQLDHAQEMYLSDRQDMYWHENSPIESSRCTLFLFVLESCVNETILYELE